LKQQEEDMEYNQRNFVIFNTSELDKIDFDQVLETSAETVRKSVDESKTFVKWDGEVPACVESLLSKSQYHTYNEMIELLKSEEWTSFEEDVV
jgi:hypothetical protein